MPKHDQRKAAIEFCSRWEGRGDEQSETQLFWNDLLQNVYGVPATSLPSFVNYEKRVRGLAPDGKKHQRRIDAFIQDHGVLIEQKSSGIDLDKPRDNNVWGLETPYQQATWYKNNLPVSQVPKWIVTCNFDTFRIYNLNDDMPEESYAEFGLEDLPKQAAALDFLTSDTTSRIQLERDLSVEAGAYVSSLYDALAACYRHIDDDEEEQRSLNVLITRIVFLLYAEDAGLLQSRDAFGAYCKGDPDDLRNKLRRLFAMLDTPDAERDEYTKPELLAFPYVNGGLFNDHEHQIVVPLLSQDVVDAIAEAQAFDWSGISPTIFGSVFESTLNPETRRAGGMHYTSIENIHRCLDPLFLNDLWQEFQEACALKTQKAREDRLEALHEHIAKIRILDPAMGSGNFLTESYIQLRKLENRIIDMEQMNRAGEHQGELFLDDVDDAKDAVRVTLDQLFGIEINDFAVAVAKTALWISEAQMLDETRDILHGRQFDFLPLKSNVNLHEGNALRMDWNDVLPAEKCSYVVGNPPFYGARMQSPRQKQEVMDVFDGAKNSGSIDYCAAWYMKAAKYTVSSHARCALVSTNSICQGEQVANIWKPLWDMGIRIDFAHNTFRWDNQATDKAHVFCVIVGFSRDGGEKTLFVHATPDSEEVETHPTYLNAYLANAPDVFVYNRNKPLCEVPTVGIGNKPIDGGNYLFTAEDKDEFLRREPGAAKFFHPWVGSKEFINGYTRWCLWLGDASWQELKELPLCRERIEAVKEFRLASSSKPTQKLAETPARFHVENMPSGTSVVIPKVSSERRKYIPMGLIGPETFCSDLVFLAAGATLYHYGVMQSQFHNAWMRTVCGRLKSDYRYSAGVVYNNFVWPDPTDDERADIERCAQAVLDARNEYEGATLADMYDPNNETFFPHLTAAHKALDAAVERAYHVDFAGDEEKIVSHLFKLYAAATQ